MNRKQANVKIKELVRHVIDHLLKQQLDLMVNTLKVSNRSFWSGYQMAREIIDLGIVHTKAGGTVLDEEDVPVVGVKFSVYETGTQKVVKQVLSTLKGIYKTGKLPVGNFDFRWELEGFVTRTEGNVRVAAGKVVRRKVVMKRM